MKKVFSLLLIAWIRIVFLFPTAQGTTLHPDETSNIVFVSLFVENNAEIWINGVKISEGSCAVDLEAGSYLVECKLPNHESTSQTIVIDDNSDDMKFTLQPPIPILGRLVVSSNPSNAKVFLDGVYLGKTPIRLSKVVTGNHKIELSLSGYLSKSDSICIVESQSTAKTYELAKINEVQISSTPSGAKVFVDDVCIGNTPLTHKTVAGDYKLRLEAEQYKTSSQTVHVDDNTFSMDFTLKRKFFGAEASDFWNEFKMYFQATFGFPSILGGGFDIGWQFKNFNLELNYLGITVGNSVTWFNSEGEMREKMRPAYFGARLGYGIIMKRVIVSPQFGVGCLRLMGDNTKINGVVGLGALRIAIAFSHHVGMTITPGYSFLISGSNEYKTILDASPTVKKWVQGFNCSVGLYYTPF